MLNALSSLITACAWPLLLGISGWYFRVEVKDLLKRVSKISTAGAEFGSPTQSQANALAKAPEPENAPVIELPKTHLISEVEKRIYVDIETMEDTKKIPYLVQRLAQALLETKFEQIYSFIFGSQVNGLRELSKARGKVTFFTAQAYFEEVKSQFGSFYEKTTFMDWLSYVLRNDLARLVGDTIELTPFGSEFLTYLDAQKLPARPC